MKLELSAALTNNPAHLADADGRVKADGVDLVDHAVCTRPRCSGASSVSPSSTFPRCRCRRC